MGSANFFIVGRRPAPSAPRIRVCHRKRFCSGRLALANLRRVQGSVLTLLLRDTIPHRTDTWADSCFCFRRKEKNNSRRAPIKTFDQAGPTASEIETNVLLDFHVRLLVSEHRPDAAAAAWDKAARVLNLSAYIPARGTPSDRPRRIQPRRTQWLLSNGLYQTPARVSLLLGLQRFPQGEKNPSTITFEGPALRRPALRQYIPVRGRNRIRIHRLLQID